MTNWPIYLATTVALIALVWLAIHYGWLTRGEAGMWAALVASLAVLWHEIRSAEQGAQHPLSDDPPEPTDTHTTTPEPSYEDDHDDDHVAPDAAIDDVWRDHDRRARQAEED